MLNDSNVTISVVGIPGYSDIGSAVPSLDNDNAFTIYYDSDSNDAEEIIAHELGHGFSYCATGGVDIDDQHLDSPSYPLQFQNDQSNGNPNVRPK
jgi:hypothetical protein